MRPLVRWVVVAAAAAVLVTFPYWSAPWASRFASTLVRDALILAIFALSLDLLVGRTGMPSLGHAAFFGAGAYAAGIASQRLATDQLPVTLGAAALVAALLALVIGVLVVRSEGIFFLMLTLALAQIVFAIAFQWTAVTGGSNGLSGVGRPMLASLDFSAPDLMYVLVAVTFVVVALAIWGLARSPYGRALIGVRENERRMRALGYDTVRLRLSAFVVAGTRNARRADPRVRARLTDRARPAVAPADRPADIGRDPRDRLRRLRPLRATGDGRPRLVRVDAGEPAMIEIRELRRAFGGVVALDGVSLALAEGERRAVIGPNGAGKTTLINVLAGEIAPTGGTIRLAGRDITRLRSWQRARLGLAHVYQRTELFAPLSARDNVALAVAARRGPYRVFRAPPRAEYSEADAVLERVGLAGRGDAAARVLSHGERRQLELAVALAQRPRVLLLDEPTAGMSPLETARITELIAALDRALTILIVEHDMDVVFRLADRVTVLHEGRVIADGTAAEVRGDVRVHDVYLGKAVTVA